MSEKLMDIYAEIRADATRMHGDLKQAEGEGGQIATRMGRQFSSQLTRGMGTPKIRADTSQMEGDLKQAEGEGGQIATRMGQHFSSQLMRGLGVMEGLRLGMSSIASGMKQIEERKLITEDNGRNALMHLLKIHEAQRDILRDLPFIGGTAAAIARGLSGDAALEARERAAQAAMPRAGEPERAHDMMEAARLKAAKALGVPDSQIRAMQGATVQSKLSEAAEDADRRAANLRQEERAFQAEAAAERAKPEAKAYEKGGYWGAVRAGGGTSLDPFGPLKAHMQLTDAEAKEESARFKNVEARKLEKAAKDYRKTAGFERVAINPSVRTTAGANSISGPVGADVTNELRTTNALLQQILENGKQGIIVR